MLSSHLRIGQFVYEHGESLGPAKLMHIEGTRAAIEYFSSVTERHQKNVSLMDLKPFQVTPQYRCYVTTEASTWLMGRIINLPDSGSDTYRIQLPNDRFEEVPEAKLWVRWDEPVTDPLETLITHAHETPFFHDRRWALVSNLTAQRAASGGLTGVLSAAVELQSHQVMVARKVLEDVVPRYLLADEVGLGKTIEAGMIIRQHLIDAPLDTIIIAVPSQLITQWRAELSSKFHLDDFPNASIKIIAHENLPSLEVGTARYILVVDEAHHVAAGAFSRGEAWSCYRSAMRLAQGAAKLLLLSATPVRYNEQNFLGMLHLLDPTLYPLEDLEGFQERVKKRDDIARLLNAFRENLIEFPFMLRTRLDDIERHFLQDAQLYGLCEQVRRLLPDDDEGESALPENEIRSLMRTIRVRIIETYRLHRRVLRNRRDGPAGALVRGRRYESFIQDKESRAAEAGARLDDWRQHIALALDAGLLTRPERYLLLVQRMYQAAGGDLSMLEVELKHRLDAQGLDQLSDLPLIPGERERLEALRADLQRGTPTDRVSTLISWLHQNARPSHMDPPPKTVVFSSYTAVADTLGRELAKRYPHTTFAIHSASQTDAERETALQRFRTLAECSLIICDASGEEGLNFQFAERALHFDLPWDPNRIEQRLGRLDRFGRGGPVPSLVLIDRDDGQSVESAWFRLLRDGYGVFDRSVSALQYLIEDDMEEVRRRLTFEGSFGIERHLADLSQRVEESLKQIRLQDALDVNDAEVETNLGATADKIYDVEATDLGSAVHTWLTETLRFRERGERGRNGRDRLISYRADPHTTIVPWHRLRADFSEHLGEVMTYSRMASVRNTAHLLRLGQPLVDATFRYILTDDRGQAFAFWRHDLTRMSGESIVALRFNFVVEANLQSARELLGHRYADNLPALRRRADAIFPPLTYHLWLDDQCKPITDLGVTADLEVPYDTSRGRFRDTNLRESRLAPLHDLVPPTMWEEFCRRGMRVALQEMTRATTVDERISEALNRASEEQHRQHERLRIRRDAAGGGRVAAEAGRELEREEIIADVMRQAIQAPQLRLDSAGCIVLSGDNPFRGTEASVDAGH